MAIVVQTKRGLFAVDPKDSVVGKILRMTGQYGEAEIDRLSSSITKHSRVLFVGAHVGTLAIPVAALVKEVVTVEANPDTFRLLELNIAMNRTTNCSAIHAVAAEDSGSVDFLLSTANSGGSKRKPLHPQKMYTYDHPQTVELATAALDNLLPDPHFDCILMDIEGSEYFALQGMPKILSHCQTLVIEFIPHHLRNVSGITANDLFELLEPHFDSVFIPTKSIRTDMANARRVLNDMFEHNQEDEGIFFEKSRDNKGES